MDLDQQIQALIEKSSTLLTVRHTNLTGDRPALVLIAQQLQHLEYSILQTVDQVGRSWF